MAERGVRLVFWELVQPRPTAAKSTQTTGDANFIDAVNRTPLRSLARDESGSRPEKPRKLMGFSLSKHRFLMGLKTRHPANSPRNISTQLAGQKSQLAIHAPAVAAQLSRFPNNSVTRHQQCHWIGTAGCPHRSGCSWRPYGRRQSAVGSQRTARYSKQCPPNRALEGSSTHRHGYPS